MSIKITFDPLFRDPSDPPSIVEGGTPLLAVALLLQEIALRYAPDLDAFMTSEVLANVGAALEQAAASLDRKGESFYGLRTDQNGVRVAVEVCKEAQEAALAGPRNLDEQDIAEGKVPRHYWGKS